MEVDLLLEALILFRRNKVKEASEICSNILNKNPLDQAAWSLKLCCLTEEMYVDELENDESSVAETFLDDSVIAPNARPGTSFSRPVTTGNGPSQAVRPRSSSGRPLSGVVRADINTRPGTMEQTLRTSRTARTARAASSQSARFVRLGTASMVAQSDGPFVNLARLNVDKYAKEPGLSRLLFEYVFYTEGDMKLAHQIATVATKNANYSDWYWKNQLGKCYYRLGMYQDALKQFQSSLHNQRMVETYAFLAKVYCRIDQPLMAIEQYKCGLQNFRNDVTLQIGLARVYEQLGDMNKSIEVYKSVLREEANNIEAIACIATNYFYCGQPEVALQYYRRILQTGVNNAEIFMNLGLCCFFCQQFDLAMFCIQRAQTIANEDVLAEIWYNTGIVMMSTGDVTMASRCFRLAIASDPDHAESFCNLAVLLMREGKVDQSKALLLSSIQKGPHLFEPHFNYALLTYKEGQFNECRSHVLKALELFPQHVYSKKLYEIVQKMYTSV
ncbi:hypothetical protein AB6A40_002347 [Gnathostoma spinigerum]|uniref:Tetratricopeptide repeat protein 8 n=1 Tax=Gnathostoma spinigerum TaxID=75299 RepID=A0ABD6E6B6_9BILA